MVVSLCYELCPLHLFDRHFIQAYRSNASDSIIVSGLRAGIADRMVGIISAFYWALLTNRGLVMLSKMEGSTSIDHAYIPTIPYNWSMPFRGNFERFRQKIPSLQRVWLVNNDSYASHIYGNSDLHQIPTPNTRSIELFSNRGRLLELFNNPYHATTLRKYGLKPEIAFACAYQYLFRPNELALNMIRDNNILNTLNDSSILRIAIHIRAGDHIFVQNDNVTIEVWHQAIFNCAQDIENTRKLHPDQRVIWYLISESKSIRLWAKQQYEDKIITDTDKDPVHSDCGRHHNINKRKHEEFIRFVRACNRDSVLAYSIQRAAADIHAFSLADYHIITEESGFGKIAALSKLTEEHKIYQMCRHLRGGCITSCGRDQPYTSFQKLATEWAGI